MDRCESWRVYAENGRIWGCGGLVVVGFEKRVEKAGGRFIGKLRNCLSVGVRHSFSFRACSVFRSAKFRFVGPADKIG